MKNYDAMALTVLWEEIQAKADTAGHQGHLRFLIYDAQDQGVTEPVA
jgi:uncharacterized protein YjaZ